MTVATEQELRTLRGIVYGILNVRNGRWYIGQTRRTFWKRYVGGRWWKTTTSDVLRNAFSRYGEASFEIYILAHSVASDEMLDALEIQLIQQYNAVFPTGYCFKTGGQSYGQRINARTRARMSTFHCKHRARDHLLLDAQGAEHRFQNIVTFARERGLNPTQLSNVLRGQCVRYQGYHLPGVDLDKWHQSSSLKTVIAPDGTEHSFYNAASFCREHGLHKGGLTKVIHGKQRNHRGWQMKCAEIRPPTYRWRNEGNRNKRYESITLERDGRQYTITNDIETFCAQNGISKGGVYALTRGTQRTSHGFRLVSITYTTAYLAAHPELSAA